MFQITRQRKQSSLLCTVKSDLCFLLVSSASSLIPIPPVSQWHDHTSEVSVSVTIYETNAVGWLRLF